MPGKGGQGPYDEEAGDPDRKGQAEMRRQTGLTNDYGIKSWFAKQRAT